LKLTHKIHNIVCIITIKGDITQDFITEIRVYVRPFLEDKSLIGLIFNCQKVNFIDASGISFIVSVFKMLETRNAKFALCQLSENNNEAFKITQIGDIINIFETEEEALSSFKSS